MDRLSDRLKKALELRGMTPSDLVRAKVLSKAGIYFILDGTTKAENVRSATAQKLAKALSVNREWLLTGKGPMDGDPVHASQVGRLDPAKVAIVAKALSIVLGRRGESLDLSQPLDAEIFAEAYVALEGMKDSQSSEMELVATVSDLAIRRGGKEDGTRGERGEAGGTDRAKARKAGAGR